MTQNAVLTFTILEPKSFASGIEFNVTSSSSIPNQFSTVVMQVSVPQGKIFRGPTPTAMTVIGIPSVFKEDYGQKREETGFHLMSKEQIEIGSTFTTQQITITEGVRSELKIELLESGLKTLRSSKYSLLQFAQALIGSIVGIMISIGGAMQIYEVIQ